MANINEIIFGNASANEKLNAINALTEEELLTTRKATIESIVNEIGKDNRMYINRTRRQGNKWCSTINGLRIINNKLYVDIYIQTCDTDTNDIEYFDKFFARGTYKGYCSHLNARYAYYESDKARVMRSILLEYINYKYLEKDERARKELFDKLSSRTIINPIIDQFYNALGLWHYAEQYKVDGYNYAKEHLTKYINDNLNELIGKADEELSNIYIDKFRDYYYDCTSRTI